MFSTTENQQSTPLFILVKQRPTKKVYVTTHIPESMTEYRLGVYLTNRENAHKFCRYVSANLV